VVKAQALGADACLLGRSYVFALAAAGEAGLARLLGHMRAEIDTALALLGEVSVADLGAHNLVSPPTARAAT
jgi:L-lactate dehydrogenase (cytochrome)